MGANSCVCRICRGKTSRGGFFTPPSPSRILLMDLSEAFDTINHPFLLAKLHFYYGFSNQVLAVMRSYLSNRIQTIKTNNVFDSWKDLILGLPQGSVLEPVLFNIYLNDSFFFLKDIGICNFADDTATYISDESVENVLKSLKKESMVAIRWFEIFIWN